MLQRIQTVSQPATGAQFKTRNASEKPSRLDTHTPCCHLGRQCMFCNQTHSPTQTIISPTLSSRHISETRTYPAAQCYSSTRNFTRTHEEVNPLTADAEAETAELVTQGVRALQLSRSSASSSSSSFSPLLPRRHPLHHLHHSLHFVHPGSPRFTSQLWIFRSGPFL